MYEKKQLYLYRKSKLLWKFQGFMNQSDVTEYV